jgi:hypothetical protein
VCTKTLIRLTSNLSLSPRIPRSKPGQSVLVEFSPLKTTRDLLNDLYVNGDLEGAHHCQTLLSKTPSGGAESPAEV